MLFRNRFDAGRQLAAHLTRYAGRPDVVVLALPRSRGMSALDQPGIPQMLWIGLVLTVAINPGLWWYRLQN